MTRAGALRELVLLLSNPGRQVSGTFDHVVDCAVGFIGIFDDRGRFLAVIADVISLYAEYNHRFAELLRESRRPLRRAD